MLVLALAAASAPMHVVVDYLPVAPGLPLWITTLISAGIGAGFAIMSGALMEILKPQISKWLMKRTVLEQLSNELMDNLNALEAAERIIARVTTGPEHERELAMDVVSIITASPKRDRYDANFTTQKPLVYEIDSAGLIAALYGAFGNLTAAAKSKRFDDVKKMLYMTTSLGKLFVNQQNLTYRPIEHPLEQAYNSLPDDGQRNLFED
jgi:hypothetical protein